VVSATSGDLTRLLEKEGGREAAAGREEILNPEFESLAAPPPFSLAAKLAANPAAGVKTELPLGGFGEVGEGVGGAIRSG